MKQYVVGVDLGGTKVEACLMDTKRNVYNRYRQPVQAAQGLDLVMQNIQAVIREVAEGKPYAAVGMGTPGTYAPEADRIYGSPHTPVYEIPGFIQGLKDVLEVPLVVENDANCLALAEFFASCEGKYRYVLAVIMGTGFGSGLILDNKLYRGARGGAGEIGHTTIVFNGRLCECGRRGCVEAYLSGPSLSRRFYDLSKKNLDAPGIYNLYQQEDPQAAALFEESFKMLGEVFANAVNTFDLEAIILGGGVSNIPAWYQQVPPYMKKSLFGIPRGDIPLIPAKLGDSAGVLGAAYLALRQLGVLCF
ncbi:MAG: ROK family protein [Candidatus Aminicenantes bacterium]|nr:MAG: ROK family protein [Candidatus Aminicenantes bacterium]